MLVEGRSAVNTVAPWPLYADSQARVLHVQMKLHKWAVADQQKKFRGLFNLVYDLGTLRVAWERVRTNRGSRSAGVDGATCSYIVENIGVEPGVPPEVRTPVVMRLVSPYRTVVRSRSG
jgi:RNA-directed DNA polymerase